MARRQNQPINTPSMQELIAAFGQPQAQNQPDYVKSGIQGLDLQNVVLKRKQEQEDRVRTLKEKIDAAKREQAYKKAAGAANPDIANEIGYIPKDAAKSILKGKLAEQSDEAKLARANLRGQAPDKVKQLFQLADGTTVGVTYGGEIRPINVPGGGKLNPMTKTLPAEQVEKSGTFQAMGDLIARIKADIVNPQTGQLSEEGKSYLGPLDAPSQIAKAYTPKADPIASNFHQKLQDLKNQIIYLRSGKQINEEEYKRLRASLPSEYRDESIFLSNLDTFERTFKDVMAKRQQAFQQAGYKVPGIGGETPPTGNPGQTRQFRVIGRRPSGSQ